ncbi:MAG: type II toxin-antitoxin system HipA family toxin [Sulfurimonas sp.]|nr:type II toxin-antitoxin system HipA family toxin [Sulfurimonas sp.]
MILVRGVVYFKYDKNFTMKISPLYLELTKAQYSFKDLDFQHSIAGVFADSLPDSFGMKVIDGYFERNYKKFEPNIIDKLLFIGDVSLGALSYKPAIDALKSKNIPIELKDAKTLKKNILQKNSFSSIRIAIDMYKSFSSAGGARQKMILGYNKKDNKFYIGKEKKSNKSIIVKIDESDNPGYGADAITEFIYSKVAKECGINITKTYLFEDEDGYRHFAIERFDIDKDNNRLHTHTLAGLLHVEKSKRIDYIDIMKIVKLHLGVPQEDIQEMYRRMVFNYVYNNNDDHLKNYSFLMNKNGEWRLSPAYDLMYNNTNGQRVMMLNINNKMSDEVSYSDFEEVAKELNIDNYKKIINKILSSEKLFISLLDEMMDEKLRFHRLELLQINKSIF